MEIDWIEVFKSVGVGFIVFFVIAFIVGALHIDIIFSLLAFLLGIVGLIVLLYFLGLGVRSLIYNILSRR